MDSDPDRLFPELSTPDADEELEELEIGADELLPFPFPFPFPCGGHGFLFPAMAGMADNEIINAKITDFEDIKLLYELRYRKNHLLSIFGINS